MLTPPPGRRAVIVAGLRTPFAKAGTTLRDATAADLARHCTRELLYRTELSGTEVDEVIMGQVISSPLVFNIAREVSLLPQLPRTIPAYTLNRACASGAQAICNAADQIMAGHADVVLAGGVDTLSDVPILHTRKVAQVLAAASRAKSLRERLGLFAQLRLRDLKPVSPAIAEPSTGESMGQSAEKMAKENHISREAQDELALMSHQRAAAATNDGRMTAEIAPWFGGPNMDQVVTTDNLIRPTRRSMRSPSSSRCSIVATAASRPGTHRRSPMARQQRWSWRRRRRGRSAIARWRRSAATRSPRSIPGWQLLMGPAYAVPVALKRAGITWQQLGLVEIHEAFAAQVLSNIQAWSSSAWAKRLGLPGPVGEVDWSRTNVMGGSIAVGHPFGATGSRLVTTLANEMARRDVQFGLISICAQGGMGFALVLERVA